MNVRQIFKSPSKTLAMILAVFCFVMVGYSLIPQVPPSVAHAPSSATRVSGVVYAEVERRVDGQRIVLNSVAYADDGREGRLLVWGPLYPEVTYGDTLVFNCRIEQPEPFNGFAYDMYLATKDIYAVCYQPQYIDVHPATGWSVIGSILRVKQFMMNTLHLILPEPQVSFLSGLLFGGSTALSSDLKEDFQATGTSHILAASGYNVSIFSVTFLAFILASPIGRRRGLILTTCLLVVYVIIAGASAAVVRAGMMGFLVVLEKWISRKAYLLNVMLLTASVMLACTPGLLLYDVGFQLSFVATIAILTLTKPISTRLDFVPETLRMREAFAGSLGAIVLTLPIILWHFGAVSVVAPFTNLLVLPFVPYAMVSTAMALIVGSVSVFAGTLVGLPAWGLSYLMLRVIEWFGSIPFALVDVEYARLVAGLLVVGYMAVWLQMRKSHSS